MRILIKKIKKFFAVGSLILSPMAVFAARGPLVVEAPFDVCTSAFSVSVASAVWTAVPGSNCAGRTGIFVNQLNSNTGSLRCIATNSSTVPSVSTSAFSVWDITPAGTAENIPARDATFVYCVTSNVAGPETVSGVEYKQ